MTLLEITGCMNLIIGKAKRSNFKLLQTLIEFSMKAHRKQFSDNGSTHTQITRQNLKRGNLPANIIVLSKTIIYELKIVKRCT